MSGLRVLVADHDVTFLEQARADLEAEGYQVDVVPDGREALARAQVAPPDLVIADVKLPRLDVWKLVKRLRALDGLEQVPVIFLSQRHTETARRHALKVGVDDVLLKPVHPETLAFRVAKALSRRYRVELAHRTLKKASDTRRLLLSRQAKAPPPPPESAITSQAALSGTLQEIGLPTVLGMLDVESKTGRLTLVNDGNGTIGWVELRSGRAIRAHLEGDPPRENRDAIIDMLAWPSGAFRFFVEPVEGPDAIDAVTTELLIEGARTADESARLVAVTPDPEAGGLEPPPPPEPLEPTLVEEPGEEDDVGPEFLD